MILEEEFHEANMNESGASGACFAACLCAVGGATLLHMGIDGALVPTIAASLATGGLALYAQRCRRTIKAWRDQKRLELAQREVEKMGGEM